MEQLMSLARSRAADLPLRPLLYAAGAAVTAAGVYYYMKKRGDEERTAEHAHTPLTQEPLQTVCADSALVESDLMCDVDGVSVPQTDSPVPAEDSLSEAEEKNQKDEVSSAPEDSERSNLEDRVRELEKLLCEAHRECEIKSKECERERKAHSILKSKYDQMAETLTHKEESIKNFQVSLAESEEKYELVIESLAELEKEKSKLLSNVDTLQGLVQRKEKELCEAHRQCGMMMMECEQKKDALYITTSKYRQMKTALKHNCMLLNDSQDTLAVVRQKYQQLMKINTELKMENSYLTADSDQLQDWLHEMEQKLSEIQCEKKKLKEDLQVSQADAEEKYELVIESFTQLQSDMMFQVNTLQATVQQLEEQLRETGTKCDETTMEREQSRDSQCPEDEAAKCEAN